MNTQDKWEEYRESRRKAFKDAPNATNAVKMAVDEMMTNYISNNCEHITDGAWEDMEDDILEIIMDLVNGLSSKNKEVTQ